MWLGISQHLGQYVSLEQVTKGWRVEAIGLHVFPLAQSLVHGSFCGDHILEQGSLKDTFCNHLKHVAVSTPKCSGKPPFTRQCSGVVM